MNYLRRLFCLALSLLVLFPPLLRAQGNRGALAGTVTDSTGAIIPGVQITAKNADTGATYEGTTNSAGGYTLQQMQLGSYTLSATKQGFATEQRTGVQVTIGSTTALDLKLSPGSTAQSITVDANAPQVQTESSEIGTTITPRIAQELPLALGSSEMRSPFSFIFLAPGAVGPGTAGQGNFGFNQAGGYQTKISGGQNFGDEVLVDGISTYRQAAGETFDQVSPSVEALTQFRIITSTLPAQYGRTTGGLTSFNTQSGTNTYHGHLFEIFQNVVLDANNWFNNAYLSQCNGDATCIAQNQRPKNNENDYGVVLGGPIRIPHVFNGRDKLFGFFSFEQYRKGQGTNITTGVPIQAQR
ncbi:MAG: carboxypeptidase regulatory-like domain-containing protein, partial [Rhodospirillales bacterium]|nr:carboxypeptidase regulatory-like domain-containing protein [Acetobacter sp.]